ncbi:benzoate/H(+) symporter BenE family transporter [Burkholderia glumae]|uniref:Benzoate/H(+) symporter BenE family transporter n=1 Tax=Burkholderia glumae TaxID=337 RepID=A0AAQ0BU94_BURGL|nr:benzoate/H(+) symporter BenE family transporter [Burkholderia glumae]ACR29750.1 Benzoate transporter [Burkholderia glumae BGR1]AJY65811.1 benzoate transporter family protein [Burkholderia glumae LMG 2196 = ATCC 33617]KHJ60184.1 membrane protein [Burkholderia glumae]MCM2482581.1 benzoate/H(+) symporter BenE family transporter [Burkholderia glumae]MCM2490777.1 benzoate/H(+) symporter BenE family transporter [Burkholderia glumae]
MNSPHAPATPRAASASRFLVDTSASTLVAGFVAMMTGYTSALVLMFQAGRAAHLSDAQISSWIWALSISMGLTTVGLSLRYRAPIVTAWSTPGAALLIASLPGVPYPYAIGAFVVCALLLTAVGVSGMFDALMKRIPAGIASALLAGILFEIGIEIFHAAQIRPALVITMFLTYLVVKRLVPRYAIIVTLASGTAVAGALGLLDFSRFHVALAHPVLTLPAFSAASIISIGIPLFIVAMASQNVPGIAVLRADGYATPSSPLLAATGLASLVFAPFGSHGINLAAITAAICTGGEAHAEPRRRYTAAVWCGVFYLIAGVFGATIAALFDALPKALVVSVAALALFGSIMSGLANAMQEVRQREAALVTFMVTASGLTLLSIGSAFWGLVAGIVTHLILNARRA